MATIIRVRACSRYNYWCQMLRKKKKGQGVVEAFSWIAMVFFTILFYILFSLGGCGKGSAEQKVFSEDLTELKVSYDLAAFLRTPAEFKGVEMTVSDLIVLAMEDDDLAEGLFPLGNTGVSFFFMDLLGLDAIDTAYTQRLIQIKGYPLTYAATNVMKTYSEFAPVQGSVKNSLFCSYKMDATRGSDKIVFYDARYQNINIGGCDYEQVLAEAKIPDSNGNPIEVKIKAIFSTGNPLGVPASILNRLLNIY